MTPGGRLMVIVFSMLFCGESVSHPCSQVFRGRAPLLLFRPASRSTIVVSELIDIWMGSRLASIARRGWYLPPSSESSDDACAGHSQTTDPVLFRQRTHSGFARSHFFFFRRPVFNWCQLEAALAACIYQRPAIQQLVRTDPSGRVR